MVDFYNASDVFLMPSITEAFGKKLKLLLNFLSEEHFKKRLPKSDFNNLPQFKERTFVS